MTRAQVLNIRGLELAARYFDEHARAGRQRTTREDTAIAEFAPHGGNPADDEVRIGHYIGVDDAQPRDLGRRHLS